MQADTGNCLLKKGEDSAQNLLSKIFVMEPRNSLCVREIAEHPWLKGPVPTEEEMQAELKRRFKGILSGTPSGTAFFDLGRASEKDGQVGTRFDGPNPPSFPRDALEGEGAQRRPQRLQTGGWRRLPKRLGGRFLSVTNAIEPGTWRQGDSGWP